jgi:hypothetical protein
MSSHTLFRIFSNEQKDIHYTAVLLKNGTYLEVKNPDTNNTKVVYQTLEEWAKAHNSNINDITNSEVSQSKTNNLKFNIISGNINTKTNLTGKFVWDVWYYHIIKTFDKSLLKNSEVIEAFNAFIDMYLKYKDKVNIQTFHLFQKYDKAEIYNPKNLSYHKYFSFSGETHESKWCGLCWSSKISYKISINPEIQKEDYTMRSEITECYKKFYDLISPTILPKMEKKFKVLTAYKKIMEEIQTHKIYKKRINVLQIKLYYKIKEMESLQDDIKVSEEKSTVYKHRVDNYFEIIKNNSTDEEANILLEKIENLYNR